MEFTDKQLTCSDCSAPFVFTVGEQRWFKEKGFEREPRRCANCRKSRKAASGHDGHAPGAGFGHEAPAGFDRGHGGHDRGHGGPDRGRRGERSGRGGRGDHGGGSDRAKFQVTCTACGAEAQVPFRPRPGSPVFCSSCYQSRRD